MPALPGAPPVLSWPCPHPTARLWLSPGLSWRKGRAGLLPLPLPLLPPASSPALSPSGQDQSVCGGEWVGSRVEQGISAVGVCGNPVLPTLPQSGELQASFPCSSFVCVAAWLAWGICLSVCCRCAYAWGRSAGAPPHMALALSMQEPQSSHFVGVFWPCGFLCVCTCVCVYVCVSWCCGLCVPVPVWLCYGLCESAASMCPCGGLCPSLCWCCALGYPRERDDSAAAPPINLCLTAPFSPCADSSGGEYRISRLGTDRIPSSKGPSTAVSFPVPPPSPPSNTHSNVDENLPGPLPPSPRTECSSLGPWLSGSPHVPWAWWQEKTGRQGAKGS